MCYNVEFGRYMSNCIHRGKHPKLGSAGVTPLEMESVADRKKHAPTSVNLPNMIVLR